MISGVLSSEPARSPRTSEADITHAEQQVQKGDKAAGAYLPQRPEAGRPKGAIRCSRDSFSSCRRYRWLQFPRLLTHGTITTTTTDTATSSKDITRSYDNGYYRGGYDYRRHRCSGTTGTIVGAGAGALLGRSIGRGSGYYHQNSGTTGTILGAALGALVGREIGKSTC